MSLEDYINLNYNDKLDDLTKFLISDAYKAGAASRQAEIDELQKQIDAALMYLRHTDSREHQEKIITKILKGKEND